MTQNTNTNPWGKAFREARTVLLPVIVVAIGFNLFSATSVPWVRIMPQGPAISNDELLGGDTTAAPANTPPPPLLNPRTTPPTPTTAPQQLQHWNNNGLRIR